MEIDPAEISKNVFARYPILGDCESLMKLSNLVNKKSLDNWIGLFDKHMKIEYKSVIEKDLFPSKDGLTMGEVINSINKHSKGIDLVTDVGQHQMVACDMQNLILQKAI